jgi:cell shape-determining protein MreC
MKRSYIFLSIILLVLLSFSVENANGVRAFVASKVSVFWDFVDQKTRSFLSLFSSEYTEVYENSNGTMLTQNEELERLKLENQLLKNSLKELKNFLFLQSLGGLDKSLHGMVPARVIYRSPASWNSSFWINIGTDDNQLLEEKVIAKNSPVLFGNSVIGIVDYAGKEQCRVRLITDSGLTPSVRVKREIGENSYFLAKGELRGSSRPMWRGSGQLLHGIGFNYEFADSEGPARDLRTGKPIGGTKSGGAKVPPALPLVKVDDLLVTTGMDGVFPPGLLVAKVTKVYPLKEGDYAFELEAKPVIENFDDLSLVFVTPPLGYDEE